MVLKIEVEVDDEMYKDFTEDDEEGVIQQLTAHWDYEKDGVIMVECVDMEVFDHDDDDWGN